MVLAMCMQLLEKYGDEHYSNHEQARKTLIERYGVDHNFKLIII